LNRAFNTPTERSFKALRCPELNLLWEIFRPEIDLFLVQNWPWQRIKIHVTSKKFHAEKTWFKKYWVSFRSCLHKCNNKAAFYLCYLYKVPLYANWFHFWPQLYSKIDLYSLYAAALLPSLLATEVPYFP